MKHRVQQQIQDPETEAKALERALHDMSKSVREANKMSSKLGLSYSEFKARFLAAMSEEVPEFAYGKSH